MSAKIKFSDIPEGAKFQGTFGKAILPLVYQKVKPVEKRTSWGSYELNSVYVNGSSAGKHCYTFPNEMVVPTSDESS